MRGGLVAAVCLVLLVLGGGTAAAAEPPANDDFADAQVVTGAIPLAAIGTTVGATRQTGEPIGSGSTPAGHSVWFRWEATSTGYVEIGGCGSESRVILSVYTGDELGALREVGSGTYTDSRFCRGGMIGGSAGVTFRAHAGTVYSIAVDGDRSSNEYLPDRSGETPIELRLYNPSPPANDNFADAVPIEAFVLDGGVAPIADTFGATREPGEPDHRGESGGASVWFTWTAPRSGGTVFGACNGPGAVVGVYTGEAVDALTPAPQIEHWSSCDYAFFATAGTTYRLAVDGRYDPALDAAEMFETGVDIRYTPHNDDFADPAPLSDVTMGNGDLGHVSNIGASKEPGEPDHAGDVGGASIWFSFTASVTGSMQLSPCEGSFPALIAVYTGPSLAALTPVASARVPAGERCLHNMNGPGDVRLDVEPGTTYHVAVDGVGGAVGETELEWWGSRERLTPPAGPAPSPTPALVKTTGHPRKVAKPTAKIAARHIDQRLRSAAFALRSTQPGARLRCELDRRRFIGCGTKVAYGHLSAGRHVFRVLAVGADGSAGAPVQAGFVIRRSG